MPQTKQAAKALRQDIKRAHRNKIVKSTIRTMIKKARKALEAKDAPKAEQQILDIIKKVDKAVQKGQLKKNTGARRKSRLMRALNKLRGGQPPTEPAKA